MSIAALIRRMREAGAPMEAIEMAVEAIEAERSKDEDRKAKQRERTAKCRARSRDSNVTVTLPERYPPPKIYNSTPHHVSPAVSDETAAPKPKKVRNRALPDDWQPGERSDAVRRELGRSVDWMLSTATDMRTWAESKGEVRADWDATHAGWMRREAKREGDRPQARGSPPPRRSSHGALSLLADRMGIPDDCAERLPPRNDQSAILEHEGDGRSNGGLYEPAGSAPGGFPQASYLRIVSAYRD